MTVQPLGVLLADLILALVAGGAGHAVRGTWRLVRGVVDRCGLPGGDPGSMATVQSEKVCKK